MRRRGRLALSIVLGIVMVLGMCPTSGIAESIDVEYDEDEEVVVDVESEEESEEQEPQLEEQTATTESLDVQDEEYVAQVQWYGATQTGDTYGEQFYIANQIDQAIGDWNNKDPSSLLVILQSATASTDSSLSSGHYRALDLNGNDLDLNARRWSSLTDTMTTTMVWTRRGSS